MDLRAHKVLFVGLAGNLLVAASKFVAASITHSAAMMSEAIHSLVDTGNELLLLYGAWRADRPPDERHPFGYGREVYFWSFIVSLLIFTMGAGFSLLQGWSQVRAPHSLESPEVSYIVLACAALFEGWSWWVAFKAFRKRKGSRTYLEAAQQTKDPEPLIVFFEDSAALIGIAIAFAGTFAAHALDDPRLDGWASIAIGVLLAGVAAFLSRENKQLLIGEGASRRLLDSVGRIVAEEKGVAKFNGLLSIQLAPREVVLALSIDFEDRLRAPELQELIQRLDERIRGKHSEIVLVMMKPQEPEVYRAARARWLSAR
jgi:cation diffusion facilitator family transporter